MKKLLLFLFLTALTTTVMAQNDVIVLGKDTLTGKITNSDNDYIYFKLHGTSDEKKIQRIALSSIKYSTGQVITNNINYANVPQSGYTNTPNYGNIERELPELVFALKNPKPKALSTDSLNYKLMYVQYNLGRFHQQTTFGAALSSSGLIFAIITPYMLDATDPKYPENVKACQFIGVGISLIGTIVLLDSYKWINRASLQPTLYGATLKVRF